MATLTDVIRRQRRSGAGVMSSVGTAAKEKTLEAIDPRNLLFSEKGLMTALFPQLRGYKAKGSRPSQREVSRSAISPTMMSGGVNLSDAKLDVIAANTADMSTKLDVVGKNTMALVDISRNISVMERNIYKLVKEQTGSASQKADKRWWKSAQEREKSYESALRREEQRVKPTKVTAEGAEVADEEKKGGMLGGISSIAGIVGTASRGLLIAKIVGVISVVGILIYAIYELINLLKKFKLPSMTAEEHAERERRELESPTGEFGHMDPRGNMEKNTAELREPKPKTEKQLSYERELERLKTEYTGTDKEERIKNIEEIIKLLEDLRKQSDSRLNYFKRRSLEKKLENLESDDLRMKVLAGDMTPINYRQMVTPTQISEKTGLTHAENVVADMIAKREGAVDPNVIFGDVHNVAGTGQYSKILMQEGYMNKPLTEMTLEEVFSLQKRLRDLTRGKIGRGPDVGTSAVGSGQFIEGTLKENLTALGINPEDYGKIKFDQELQRRVTIQNFIDKVGDPSNPNSWNMRNLQNQWEAFDKNPLSPQELEMIKEQIKNPGSYSPLIMASNPMRNGGYVNAQSSSVASFSRELGMAGPPAIVTVNSPTNVNNTSSNVMADAAVIDQEFMKLIKSRI